MLSLPGAILNSYMEYIATNNTHSMTNDQNTELPLMCRYIAFANKTTKQKYWIVLSWYVFIAAHFVLAFVQTFELQMPLKFSRVFPLRFFLLRISVRILPKQIF